MAVLLGPDGVPIQTIEPVVKAAMAFASGVGVNQWMMGTIVLAPGLPKVHVVQILWINQVGGTIQWETASGRTQSEAAHRMVKILLWTGQCANCHRPAETLDNVDKSFSEMTFDPLDEFCLVVFDPETTSYRRACDGEGISA